MRDYEQCDQECNGQQTRKAGCISIIDFRRVDEAYCNRHLKPKSETRSCNSHCQLKWQRVKTGECSTDCGMGTRTVLHKCFRQMGQKTTIVADTACERRRLKKPLSIENCRAKCPTWSYTEWSACSTTCGGGARTRRRSCQTSTGVASSSCDENQALALTQSCNTTPCPRWSAGPWTGCSRSCGGGEQKRMVSCFYNYREIDNKYCDMSLKPVSLASCNFDPCPVWSYSSWSPCPVTCGQGQQTRNITCVVGTEPSSIDLCNRLPHDLATRPCTPPLLPCSLSGSGDGTWRTSGWSECSEPCGKKGIYTRRVHCEIEGKQVDPLKCPTQQRPKNIDSCFTACPLKGEWVTGQWSSCTKSCGVGAIRKRAIGCRLGSSYKQFTHCDQTKRPQTTIPCNVPPCPSATPIEIPDFFKISTFEWRHGDWGECECTRGARRRRPVTCNEIRPSNQVEVVTVVSVAKCDAAKRPSSSEQCDATQCRLRWRAGKWSKCDAKCGQGHQTRNIVCYRGDQKVSPKNCMRNARVQAAKPRQKRSCRSSNPCPRWRRTGWTPCSTKCGLGIQTRQLRCQLRHTRRIIGAEKCASLPKPKIRRKCKNRVDCHNALWTPGEYGPCSATCVSNDEIVVKRRTVSCKYSGRSIADTYCASSDQPEKEKQCSNREVSPCAKWVTSDWGPCSVTCGRGIMLRNVDCTGGASSCLEQKPETTQVCDLGSCSAANCKDIQRLRKQSLNGNYYIEVEGKLIKVYCHLMKTSSPREYLNVIEKENFSMIYEYQLKNTTSCPAKLHRSDLIVNPRKRGRTTYKKVRFMPDKLQILTTDSTFSKTVGTKIEFGTAGDCFSSAGCPKGMFSINLHSTGLKVSNRQRWRVRGKKGHMEMWRPKTGTQLRAKCGGLCAQCQPTHPSIIQLELDDH